MMPYKINIHEYIEKDKTHKNSLYNGNYVLYAIDIDYQYEQST